MILEMTNRDGTFRTFGPYRKLTIQALLKAYSGSRYVGKLETVDEDGNRRVWVDRMPKEESK